MEIENRNFKIIEECEDFSLLHSYLIKNFKHSKTLFITSSNLYKKYCNELNDFFTGELNIKLIEMPQCANVEPVFAECIASQIQEDVKLMVVFGEDPLCNLVKMLSTKYSLPFILVPSAINAGGYMHSFVLNFENRKLKYHAVNLPKKCFVNKLVLENTSRKQFANCYADFFSLYACVIEKSFNFGIFNEKTNLQVLYDLEMLLNKFCVIDSTMLKNKEIKLLFFRAYLQSNLLVNQLMNDEHILPVIKMSFWLQLFTKNKFAYGEARILSYLFLNELYLKLFRVKYINENWVFNFEKRLSILNYYKLEIDNLQEFVYSKKECQNIVYRFLTLKDNLLETTLNYHQKMKVVFDNFKQMFFDKAMFIQKNLNSSAIKMSIFLSADGSKNLLTFMRNFGFLDKLI